MDFVYSEGQQILRDSVDRWAGQTWPATERLHHLNDGQDWRAARYTEMAELGWLMLPIPEAKGGLDGAPADVMAIAEGLGRHLVTSPYVTTCVLVPALLAEADGTADALLASIGAGEVQAAAALIEPDAGYDTHRIATRAERVGGDWRLTGAKIHVEDGGDADWFVVSARTAGADDDRQGISLFLVPRDQAGLGVERFRAIDHHRHAKLTLDGVIATPAGPLGEAMSTIELALDRAICAHLAEATGSMEAATQATLEHLRTREQFGGPIGRFQVLQHRLVDMTIACEEARAMTYQATLSLGRPRNERRRAVSAAKARVGQSGLLVGRDAVQLHGGVGFSDELIVSHHLRRQMMLDFAHGSSDFHIGLFVAADRALRAEGGV